MTSADIRSIKLNYLQLNKRSVVNSNQVIKKDGNASGKNEYTNIANENKRLTQDIIVGRQQKTPVSQPRGLQIEVDRQVSGL